MDQPASTLKIGSGSNRKVVDAVVEAEAGVYDAPLEDSCVQFSVSGGNLCPDSAGHVDCCRMVGCHDITSDTASKQQLIAAEPHTQPPAASARNIHRRRRRRVHCVYCCKLFDPERSKGRRRCRDAPDPLMDWINAVSCARLADGVMYHCFSDSDGDYEPACKCTCTELTRDSLVKWAAVVSMYLCLPCLCCFWPLIGCRKCALSLGYCIPQHRAMWMNMNEYI